MCNRISNTYFGFIYLYSFKSNQMKTIVLIILACIFYTGANGQKKSRYFEEGSASFYSNYFEGRKTASGEIFHQNQFTAAHKSLPFGTWVKVVNLQNKRSVIVRITDRGPFVKGRIIDLSQSAAKQIGSLSSGLYKVRLQVYHKDNPVPTPPKGDNLFYKCTLD